jgi:serine phosphatase RsbU (regulator of sigma subunit)
VTELSAEPQHVELITQDGEPKRPTRLGFKDWLLGVGLPVVITALLSPVDDLATYRPGVLLLLGCVGAALLAGIRAAALSAVLSSVALWWAFTPPNRSWRVASFNDLFGIILFVVAASGVVLLVYRLDDSRNAKRRDIVELGLHRQITVNQDEHVASQAAHEIEFRHALDAMLDDVDVGRALRDDNGEIVDFVIEFVNGHGSSGARRGTDGLLGQLMCEVHPDWRESGMFDKYRDVVETGIPYQGHRVQYADVVTTDHTGQPGVDGKRRQAYWTVQVAKFGDGYISASRDITEVVLAEEAARAVALEAAAEHTAISLLQAAALPTTLPQLPGVRIAAVYEPMDPSQPVGGDWYDVFALDDNLVALVIADVAGHGHSAAMFMVQVRNVFRAIAAEHTEPDEVLTRANNVTVRLNEPDGPFVTCCFAVLDIAARTLRWAQAGHFSPLLVMADGTSRYLDERPGGPLAFFEGERYESSTIDVRPGDRVVMFTDGLVERRREHLDIGLARLAGLAASHAHRSPEEFVSTLAASVTERFDDLALVCIDFVGD